MTTVWGFTCVGVMSFKSSKLWHKRLAAKTFNSFSFTVFVSEIISFSKLLINNVMMYQ